MTSRPKRGPFSPAGLALLAMALPAATHAQTETVLHSFAARAGANPQSALLRDAAGNFYGTTIRGGVSDSGVIFKVDAQGRETVLYNFTGGADGGSPSSGLIADAQGNLYGTTNLGGAGYGVVFKLDKYGHETTLHQFTGGADGAFASGGVIRDAAGNLYGTTNCGGHGPGIESTCTGATGAGVVYKLDPSGNETVLYSFGGGADGGDPLAGVVRDNAGNLYGTTPEGGSGNRPGNGVVYRVDPAGNETVLYSFTGGADGGTPVAGLIGDASGNLYGTTWFGGASEGGVVYKLDAAGKQTVLYSFKGTPAYRAYPGDLARDSSGNLYGTLRGGVNAGAGSVYKLNPAGQPSLLYSFTDGADGGTPYAGVTLDAAGNLYGTASAGNGAANLGVVYKLDPAGHETVLYSFAEGSDGASPAGGLISDAFGNFYGTAESGGIAGSGVVFKIDPLGRETKLYNFPDGQTGPDAAEPTGGVVGDGLGNLYGTSRFGGASGVGAVFKLDTAGRETVLYSFTNGTDGQMPQAGLVLDAAGNLCGTTSAGRFSGAVFKLNTAGQITVLYTFMGGTDGGVPEGDLILDASGNLYGTTKYGGSLNCPSCGVVFKVDPAGNETVLYAFLDGSTGRHPLAGLTFDAAGNLYGTTSLGGAGSHGVVFKLDPTGRATVLYSFSGGADGGSPQASLIFDEDGNLYGTTAEGGTGSGVVFKLDPAGHETVLHTFTGKADGGSPFSSGLYRDRAGNLCGVTQYGGTGSLGVLYCLKP